MDVLIAGLKILPAWAVVLNILIVLAGLSVLNSVLQKFFTRRIARLTVLLIYFGTNYFQLVSGPDPYPNNLLFTLFTFALWFTIRWHEHPSWTFSILLGLTCGAVILINPSDWAILLVPVFWGIHDRASLKEKRNFIRKNIIRVSVCLDALVLCGVMLFVFWKPLSAFFGYGGYSEHGIFRMTTQYFPQVMFSLKNGWLVYTPMTILAFTGFYFLASRNREIYYSVFLFFLANVIYLCSWNTYAVNDEFGRRMFVQSLAILALPLGSFLQSLQGKKPFISFPIYLLLVFFVVLNLFQTWQYRTGILAPVAMNRGYYCTVFAKTSLSKNDLVKLMWFDAPADVILRDSTKFNCRTIAFQDYENTEVPYAYALESEFVRTGKYALKMDSGMRYANGIRIGYSELTKKNRVGIRISAWVMVSDTTTRIPANLIINSIHGQTLYHYRFFPLNKLSLTPHVWNYVSMNYITPEYPDPSDELQATLSYTGNFTLYVDDLKVTLFEPKE